MNKCNCYAIIVAAFIVLSHVACSRDTAMRREDAIRIAEREARKLGWREFKVSRVEFATNHWEVLVWRLPAAPGLHVSLDIGTNGDVMARRAGE